MRIGIDARLWSQTGVGRYIRNLISELTNIDGKNEYVIYLRKDEYSAFATPSERWKKRLLDVPWHTFAEQIKVPLELKKDNLDVAHFPYFNVPIFYNRPFLLTIHDLIVDHFDTGMASTKALWFYKLKRAGYKLATRLAITKAAKITVISQTTRDEVIDHYHVDPKTIEVTFDGLDSNFQRIADSHKATNYYNFPYIIYVGNAYPHKNLERLIYAMKKISKSRIKLVLAGTDDYFYPRLKDLVRKESLSKNIIFFGSADDEQLVNLYTYAKCLVFPSLMEGFGLPNMEAVYCGCLPIVSDIPVFREVWKDDLSYFNPYNIDDMAEKILKSVKLDNDYKLKVRKAKLRIDKYNWRKTANQTLKIYEDIYHENSIRI